MRSKQEFKALREQVGMSQTDLALALDVSERSVKRWESVKYKEYNAAQEVGGYPASVKLVYWSSQAEYDEHHCVDDDGDWRQANATARIVSYALHERGIETDWISGADNLVPKQ